MKAPASIQTGWPPIIAFARAPWYVRVRDLLLTIGAWALLVYLTRDGLYFLYDYLSRPIFQLTRAHPEAIYDLLERLRVFAIVAIGLMLWLVLWGYLHRQRLRSFARITPPPPLAVETHAAGFGLDAATVEHWRTEKVAVVEFDAADRIAGITPRRIENRFPE